MLIEIPESMTDQLWDMAADTLPPEVQLIVPQDEWVRATAVLLLSRALAEHAKAVAAAEAAAEPEKRRGRGPAKRHLLEPYKDAIVSEIINNMSDIKRPVRMLELHEWALDAICQAHPDSLCPAPDEYRKKYVRDLVAEMRAGDILVKSGPDCAAVYSLHTAKKPAPAVDNEIPF